MRDRILVAYATRYGSTKEVAEQVAATLRECGYAVDLRQAQEVRTLGGYGAVVLGAALYMYRWHRHARRFLSRHRQALVERPVAVFALGPVQDEEEQWEDARSQLDKQLAKFPWFTPVAVEMFGGKFDPADLPFPINRMAGNEPVSDIRDWEAIRAWANELPGKLGVAQ
jgi:menaquinone-dependent protoporphyrinogen oxidase